MIEKDTRIPRIHHLRIIHLFGADFNLLFLQIMWGSRLVCHSIKLNLLNDGHQPATALFMVELPWAP